MTKNYLKDCKNNKNKKFSIIRRRFLNHIKSDDDIKMINKLIEIYVLEKLDKNYTDEDILKYIKYNLNSIVQFIGYNDFKQFDIIHKK